MTGWTVRPVIASEASLAIAIGKYYSSSKKIDIFDFAAIGDLERNGKPVVTKNGNGNGGGAKVGERLVDSDLTVSLDRFEFDKTNADEFELIEENEEIDLAEL